MYYCGRKDNCPYLRVLEERIKDMEKIMEVSTDKVLELKEKIKLLEEENKDLQDKLNRIKRTSFKPNVKNGQEHKTKQENKRGAPLGHKGTSRRRSEVIDEYVDIYPTKCNKCQREDITVYNNLFAKHIVEDIEIKLKTTCYRYHYGYCSKCKRTIYPRDSFVPSRCRIGPNARAISCYLRYKSKIPFDEVGRIFKDLFNLNLSPSSLVNFENKMAENSFIEYEKIKSMVKNSSFIHSDETGWRVDGRNYWLWCFTNDKIALYHIDKTRGSDVVKQILGKDYKGVLISDFYSAYNSISASAKQKCIVHLLRDIKDIKENKELKSTDNLFCEMLKETLQEAIDDDKEFRCGKKTSEELKKDKEEICKKLTDLMLCEISDEKLKTLRKRIIKHNNELLTFFDNKDVEPTNNRAERNLRPNVIMRKVTFGNRSQTGVRNHQVLMSVLQTGVLSGANPFDIFLSLNFKDKANLSFIPLKIRAP
jgi:hypothetical protein